MRFMRILAFLLALLMSVSAFASCGNGSDTDETNGEEAVSTGNQEDSKETHPYIEKKNYDEEFYITIMTHVNMFDYHWVKEAGANTLSDAIYDRQEKVRQYLGVEVFATKEDDSNRYITGFQSAVKNKDGSVHMLVSHCSTGLDLFIEGNYFMDYYDTNAIDLEADYWDSELMDEISINGHMYLGFSDYNIVRTNVVAFNKEMFSLYEDAIDDDFYNMVSEYRWTLDKMISVANLVYTDATSDGKTIDDTFGISSDFEVPYASLIQASNINLVEQNAKGMYEVAIYNDKNKQKMSDLVDKLKGLVASDSAYFDPDPSFGPPANVFVNKRSLMYLARTTTLPGFLDDDIDFGVLPYPMYDELQKDVGYRSLQWGGYLCIPAYLENPNMVFETMEMISFFSEDVNTAYYEKLLGKQIADAPLDRNMLDIVWDSVCSDIGLTYSSVMGNNSVVWVLSAVTKPDSTMNLASYMASRESGANKAFKRFVSSVK